MNEGVNKSAILVVATMGSFLTPFMGASINMALPSMGKELTMSAIMLGVNWGQTPFFRRRRKLGTDPIFSHFFGAAPHILWQNFLDT